MTAHALKLMQQLGRHCHSTMAQAVFLVSSVGTLCRYVTHSGCLDVWMSGCLDVWMSGCLDVWMSDVWMSGCLDVWMSGLDVWMSRFSNMSISTRSN